MKFMIGYQADDALLASILRHRDAVSEIYFPWDGFSSGRGPVKDAGEQRRMEADLDRLAAAGLGMNLLLNADCYGRHSQSRAFFQRIGDTVDELTGRLRLSSVTTTSPLIARFLKTNFPELERRASVNLEIGEVAGFEYLEDDFDGFYLKRECNRDLPRLTAAHAWTLACGKKLYLLANSGCLNFCSAHHFHDTLVAHQREIAEMDNAYSFAGVCHEYLARAETRTRWLERSSFIRPEDVPLYESLCDGIKLATRSSANPALAVDAYTAGHFSGNLPDLLEPAFSAHFYPDVPENSRLPADFGRRVLHCGRSCDACGYWRPNRSAARPNSRRTASSSPTRLKMRNPATRSVSNSSPGPNRSPAAAPCSRCKAATAR